LGPIHTIKTISVITCPGDFGKKAILLAQQAKRVVASDAAGIFGGATLGWRDGS
jgi:hypothetical protein